ncbi:MAG: histidine--tRNA ligase [Muribaculaceae bacterium]|nr:histidine--tRNA ligase [Muribaculaceae bacterium]
MAQKPSIPKGTRDFGPIETARRNYIFSTIRSVFELFGFSPIETPSIENLSTLMGKYGEEGDKLLFKILNSGEWLREIENEQFTAADSARLTSKVSEKGLRYDLTVPFARFVVQHRNELTLPFKRYQIQPVWRADRPQKGRYREFYQCDADIVGSDSLTNEVELLQMIDEVFARLNIRIAIKLNNRKVLAGIAEIIGEPDRLTDITVAIDKIDKIGIDNVKAELEERGLSKEAVEKIVPVLSITGTAAERLQQLKTVLAESATGLLGVAELEQVLEESASLDMRADVELDVSLARGLNYYTGTIIEVKALDTQIGSISGGGRYDNLTGVFGMPGLSGVGISFGADRIYDVLTTLNLFPDTVTSAPTLMFANFGKSEALAAMAMMKQMRAAGIACEIYPDTAKMKKQMAYADTRGIPFVAMVGENEAAQGKMTLKNMTTGEQTLLSPAEALEIIRK